ncbi:unnamed protein product [Rotaria sordida]|uniref:Uncharacterized protein n=1 Tax=Rotaria sordida TaxID=392033 RepID=A0A814LZD5_9BILA|nr:unnamed protein product [Rotaria sordida]
MFPLRSGPILLLPVVQPHLRFFSPQIPLNSNALLSTSSSLPKSFPIPMENRDDFFCVDPKSLSIEQLNKYKKEIIQLIDIEKNNFERIKNDSNARINAYNQGILLAKETIKTNSIHSQNIPNTTFLPNFKPTDDGPIGCVDPKTLTITQLQLYIEGITEEITYEKKLTDEFKKESTSRIEAYQNGIQRANYELSIRKGK